MTEIRPGNGQKGQVQMDSEWTFTDLFLLCCDHDR